MRLLNCYMSQWGSMAKEMLSQISIIVRFFGLLHVTNNYLCSYTLVHGPSMLPTLNLSGDVVLVEHLSHRLGKVGPGDVVVVQSPLDPTKMITKRIVGMEGDRVTFLPDHAFSLRGRTIEVPKGHIWIQGDNKYASSDSRHFGPVPYSLIQGKVCMRDVNDSKFRLHYGIMEALIALVGLSFFSGPGFGGTIIGYGPFTVLDPCNNERSENYAGIPFF